MAPKSSPSVLAASCVSAILGGSMLGACAFVVAVMAHGAPEPRLLLLINWIVAGAALGVGEPAPRLAFPRFGFFGLNPYFLFPLPAGVIPAPTGRASLPLPIPKLAALKGLFFYTQAILLHSQNVRDWRLTGVTADRLH